tara:strand:- start:851 stop:1060 length:210 start_codon:yes stop_codon:yes gene_type:complete
MFNTAYKAYNNLVLPETKTDEVKPMKSGLLTRSKDSMLPKQNAMTEYDRVARYVSNIRAKREALKTNGK